MILVTEALSFGLKTASSLEDCFASRERTCAAYLPLSLTARILLRSQRSLSLRSIKFCFRGIGKTKSCNAELLFEREFGEVNF